MRQLLTGKMLKVDPTNSTALSGLITMYSKRQEFDKAHARIDQVLSSKPEQCLAALFESLVFSYQRNAQATEVELRKRIELDLELHSRLPRFRNSLH